MKNKTTSILLFGKQFTLFAKFFLIVFFLFSQDGIFAQQEKIKTFSQEPYPDEPVIPFVSPSPQTDWNIKRQTGRLVGMEPVMFFDDDFIFSINGLTRNMHSVKKHGIISKEKLPYNEDLYGKLRIRQLLRTPDDKGFLAFGNCGYKDKRLVTLFYTSDGRKFDPVYVNQVAPELIWDDLPEEKLPEENNVLAFFPGEEPQFNLPAWGYNFSAFFEFPEGKEYKYGAFFINKYPRPRQTWLFGSMDGINWESIDHNPLTVIDETNAPTYDPFQDRYLIYLRHWDPHEKPTTGWRKVLLSESYKKNGELNFTDEVLVFEADESDPAGADIYNMPVFSYAGKYVGTPTIYNRRMSDVEPDLLESITVELAFSHDGYQWQRIGQGNQFLPQGRDKSWDSGMTGLGRPAIVNNRLLFHYWGTNRRHDEGSRIHGLISGIGSASLRIDGFVSLDAGGEGGTLVTVPFFPQGKHLYLNADARDGEIRVEVLQDGHSVELKKAHANQETLGLFSMDKCIPILGDSIAHLVKWKHGENFVDNFPEGWNDELLYVTRRKQFEERAIVLKIYIENAKLYSFWFADELMPVEAGRLFPVPGK